MSWYDIIECYWTAKYLLVRIYSKSVVCLTLFSCLGCTNLYRRTWLCCIEPRPQPPFQTAHLLMHASTDWNISHDTLPFTHKYAHIHHSPSSPQKHLLSSRHTLRLGEPHCAIKFISLLQIDNLIYSSLLCGTLSPDLGGEERRNHSIITFYSFIPLQQWCCHPEMAPVCHLAPDSQCFMLMTEISWCLRNVILLENDVCCKAQVV